MSSSINFSPPCPLLRARAARHIYPEGSMWKAIVAGISEGWLGRFGAIAAVVVVGAFIVTVLVAELAWMLKP